jgi:hypothetical protein
MSGNSLTLPEIRREGFRALLDRLGPADALRFLQQFDPGIGDYTKDRQGVLGDAGLDELVREIERRRKSA